MHPRPRPRIPPKTTNSLDGGFSSDGGSSAGGFAAASLSGSFGAASSSPPASAGSLPAGAGFAALSRHLSMAGRAGANDDFTVGSAPAAAPRFGGAMGLLRRHSLAGGASAARDVPGASASAASASASAREQRLPVLARSLSKGLSSSLDFR